LVSSKPIPIATLTRAQRRQLVLWSALRAVGSIVLLVLIYYLLPLDRRTGGLRWVGLIVGLTVLAGVSVWQVRAILRSAYPTLRAIEALAVVVPLFLLAFALTYFLMAQASAASFTQPLSRTDSLYFAVTVFSTVGFGDITAKSEAARIIVTIQMLADLAAIGLGLRVIVGAVKWARQRAPTGPAA
jgi:voltage-gated potassium channel